MSRLHPAVVDVTQQRRHSGALGDALRLDEVLSSDLDDAVKQVRAELAKQRRGVLVRVNHLIDEERVVSAARVRTVADEAQEAGLEVCQGRGVTVVGPSQVPADLRHADEPPYDVVVV